MAFKSLGGAKLAVILFILCAAVVGGIGFISESAIENLMAHRATEDSEDAAKYIADRLPEVEKIISGAPPSAQSQAFLTAAIEAKNIETLKLFSTEGRLVFDSSRGKSSEPDAEPLGAINKDAMAAAKDNRGVTEFDEESTDETGRLISEAYVPIHRGGKVIGVAEVYLDQTEGAADFRGIFITSAALITLLAALGSAVPAFGFYLRTRQKQAADESVQFLANHDALTSLPNRTQFAQRLSMGLNGSADSKTLAAVHFVDVDHFKEINDRHGHEFGDAVLKAIARKITGTLRENDVASRFGGDEFIIAQFGLKDHEELASATKRIARAFQEPLRIKEQDISVTASIGTAVGMHNAENAEQLMVNADTAVYVVKARGRNGHCFFEAKFDDEKRKRLEMEALLRKAVAEKSFEIHFQPLFKFGDGQIRGFEALLRLRDDHGKPVPPSDFIPAAEQIGLIDEIGHWVLENACRTAALWPAHMQISVNLSVAQFRRRSILPSTKSALAKTGLAPERLLLEITESLLLADTNSVLEQLADLKKLGVSIVMDDFGTGYSSLGYMLKFPFDHIKIDRSFVNQMEAGNDSANKIVHTIIELGHTLNMNVTAEGVETEAQAHALLAMNCDDAQGYLFGRPMPAADIPALLLKSFTANLAATDASPAQSGNSSQGAIAS
jgi:diguanylate cyclase (GGDEF)-like protein